MTAFRVLRAGIQATVQDAGRAGLRALGVPGSGALDLVALGLVNALVGNARTAAALETLYSGFTLQLSGGTARVALAGAGAIVTPARGAPRELPPWRSTVLAPGDTLRIGAPRATAAAYLAVEGGYAIPPVLGSVATYVEGALGGCEGRALRVGDVVPLAQVDALPGDERCYPDTPALGQPVTLRVIPGPQAERFTGEALQRLVSAPYCVTPASNRTGLRLEGPPLAHSAGHDLLSEGIAPGAVQVPGSGQPVVLIADHPTVGGYPKIATVISADLPAAGRLRIGASVRFAVTDAPGAAAARHALAAWIAELVATIGPVQG